MAVYKIFASQDATIYSEYPDMNTGMDAILDLGKGVSVLQASSSVARALIQFDTNEIQTFINENNLTIDSYYLRLFLSEAAELPIGFTISADPVAQQWNMGTGRYLNFPQTMDGVSWNNSMPGQAWNASGGSWVTGSTVSQSFGVYQDKDLNLNVTNIMSRFVSGSLVNNGFLLRNIIPAEYDASYHYTLSYFSRDTNTIYPPVLELKWDDSVYDQTITGSIASTPDLRVSLSNNKGEYREEEVVRFRIQVREQYPERRFATASIYTEQKFMPPTTYWAIQDVKDAITVVDFDDHYTKVSADTESNYFDIYMNGLEPERYYKLLIKTVIGSTVVIYDDQYFFKVKQ